MRRTRTRTIKNISNLKIYRYYKTIPTDYSGKYDEGGYITAKNAAEAKEKIYMRSNHDSIIQIDIPTKKEIKFLTNNINE